MANFHQLRSAVVVRITAMHFLQNLGFLTMKSTTSYVKNYSNEITKQEEEEAKKVKMKMKQ